MFRHCSKVAEKTFGKQILEMLKMWVTLDKAFGYMINQNLNSQEE